MNSKKRICRLCLKVAKSGFQEIDDTMKQLFDILLLKMDLDLTRDPIICQDCAEVAKKCLNFKSLCIHREEMILSLSAGGRKSKQSIQLTYAENENIVIIVNDEGLDICQFCMSRLVINNFMALSTLLNDTLFEMITKYMPEMDFNVPEELKICTTCRENLEGYSRFVLNCLDTETKIKGYCKVDKNGTKKVIHLDSVLHFLFKDIVEYPLEYQIHEIKQESNRTEDTEDIYPEALSGIIKQEILDIKDEEINLNGRCYGNPSEIIKTHMFVHKVVSEVRMLKCTLCAYETKHRSSFRNHLLVHKNISEIKMFKCALCAYESKIKSYLTSHMLVHRNVSEIKMFKCPSCEYEAKRKRNVTTHMLVHKDVSETKMFKCPSCAYEAKRKNQLTAHMLVHKDVAEIKMFKCALCAYEAKTKRYLVKHMIAHKDVSEIKMFKCALCAYEFKRKKTLKRHINWVHNDVSEIKMFKCALCAYKAKRKCYLATHMLVHKDVSEIKMFKCALCAYKAKRKCYLATHMLVHKDVSKIEMFKCSLCGFQTKSKGALYSHKLVHK